MNNKKLLSVLSVLFVILISIVVYTNSLFNGFVYDDERTIIDNPLLKKRHLLTLLQKDYLVIANESSYRPFVTLTYILDSMVFGTNPMGYHLTNIMLHVFNIILMYTFLTLLKQPNSGQKNQKIEAQHLIILLLFAIHPLLTEAVNAVSFREDLLLFLFYIATLNLYIILRSGISDKPMIIYLISCLFYLLALLSKEMALTLPLIIFCYDWVYSDYGKRKGSLFSVEINRYNMGYIAITVVYLYIRFIYYSNPHEISPNWTIWERLLTTPFLILSYFKLALFPISLSADYIISPVKSLFSFSFFIPFIFLLVFLFIAFIMQKRKKEITLGIIFYIIALIPVYNIIPIAHPFAERYFYLPSVGFAIVTGSCIYYLKLKTRPLFVISIFSVILIIFSLTTITRNRVWRDNYSLWSDTVVKMPDSSRAHYNLGLVYYKQKQFVRSIQEYQTALRIEPSNPVYHNNLGVVYADQGIFDKAMQEFGAAMALKHDYSSAYHNIGMLFLEQGELEKAIEKFKKALRLKSNDSGTHYNLGLAYLKQGTLDNAIQEFQNAIELNPDFYDAHSGLGDAYYKQGLLNEAMQEYLTVLRLYPYSITTHINLGILYGKMGMFGEAIQQFLIVLRWDFNDIDTHYNLGVAYLKKGLKEKAKAEFETTLRLKPGHSLSQQALTSIN